MTMAPSGGRRFISITHLHIYAIVNTIISYKLSLNKPNTLRILDIGCGNGILLSTLLKELPPRYPDLQIEFYGLDVEDSHIQERDYLKKTLELLNQTKFSSEWNTNLRLIHSEDHWPFEDNFFDIIYSNQVLEHVFNQHLFFNEIKRTMKQDGYSFHLFPLKHYFYEGHLLIPFVHKFKSWTSTYHWIKGASYLGLGKYRVHKKEKLCTSIQHFSERHADYLFYEVNYQTALEITKTAKSCRLKPSFDFTSLYYKQKLRSVFKLRPLEVYKLKNFRSFRNSLYFFFFKYVAGITLMVRKKNIY